MEVLIVNFILANYMEIPFLYCRDNIVLKVNNAFENFTGYEYSEILGRTLEDLWTLFHMKTLASLDDIGNKSLYSIKTRANIQKQIIISWDYLIDRDEKIYFIEDITHRSEIEEYSLLKRNLSHNLFSYLCLSYPDLNIIYINDDAYGNIHHYGENIDSKSSVIGKNFFEYYNLDQDTKDQLMSQLRDSIKQEPFLFIHNRTYIEDGENKFIKIIFQPIFNSKEDIEKIIAIGMEISQDEIYKKEKGQALDIQEEIFVNTSHELKTPLNLIFSASQLLDLYLKKDDLSSCKNIITHSTNIILQNCYRLTKLINNILDLSKLESGYYELSLSNENIVVVVENIVDCVSDHIKDSQFKIIFDTDIEEKIIPCDPHKIDRIILILISNGIKFSDPGGIIYVNLLDKGDFIEISVKDNGMGIEEKNFNLIFQKFIQIDKSLNRASEGSGIGLSIVKSLVHLHGGSIGLESTLGEGSTFTILLPALPVDHEDTTMDLKSSNIMEMIKFEFSDIYNL